MKWSDSDARVVKSNKDSPCWWGGKCKFGLIRKIYVAIDCYMRELANGEWTTAEIMGHDHW